MCYLSYGDYNFCKQQYFIYKINIIHTSNIKKLRKTDNFSNFNKIINTNQKSDLLLKNKISL
jgi:hypothetical protein